MLYIGARVWYYSTQSRRDGYSKALGAAEDGLSQAIGSGPSHGNVEGEVRVYYVSSARHWREGKQRDMFMGVSQKIAIVLAVLLTGLGAFAPGVASAAQSGTASGNSYVTKMTGEKIAWKSPWKFSDSISKQSGDSELVALQNGSSGLLIGFFPGNIALDAARDELLGSVAKGADDFQTLDRGAYSNVSYSLDKMTLDEVTFGVFTLFLGDTGHGATVLYTYLSPVDSFTPKMNSAKTKITIAGNPIFEGVTPDGLQALLGGNSNSTANTANSSQATEQQDPRASYQEVDVRDLSIRTDNFKGQKITVSGTVFNIQAEGGFTGIQIWVTAPDGSDQPVIIGYSGDSSGIYEGTYITVYGVCTGRITGTNRLGGVISQPSIMADIIDH